MGDQKLKADSSKPKAACDSRPMTEMEVRACRLIAPVLVRYPRMTADAHNARWLSSSANRPEPRISQDWADVLWSLVRRYRSQVLSPDVIAEADRQVGSANADGKRPAVEGRHER